MKESVLHPQIGGLLGCVVNWDMLWPFYLHGGLERKSCTPVPII